MIKLKDLLTEGKITSDVDRAAKKIGIKFKKKVKTKFTNDFTGPNEKGEKVKYDDWHSSYFLRPMYLHLDNIDAVLGDTVMVGVHVTWQ